MMDLMAELTNVWDMMLCAARVRGLAQSAMLELAGVLDRYRGFYHPNGPRGPRLSTGPGDHFPRPETGVAVQPMTSNLQFAGDWGAGTNLSAASVFRPCA